MRRPIVISWHRFYDPETGRYISADPIGLRGGINLYAYVEGNPVNAIDPRGLFIVDDLCPPNWEWSDGNCFPKPDPGGCPSGEFSDPFGTNCGRTDRPENIEEIPFSSCLYQCLLREATLMSLGEMMGYGFRLILVSTGVGTFEVVAYDTVTGFATTFALYDSLQRCLCECGEGL